MLPDDPEDYDPGLAQERTRLAWARTAIAFAAVGAVVLRKDVLAGAVVLAMAPLVWWLGRIGSSAREAEQFPRRLLVVTVAVVAVSLLAILVSLLARSPGSLDQLLPRHG